MSFIGDCHIDLEYVGTSLGVPVDDKAISIGRHGMSPLQISTGYWQDS